MLCLPGVDRKNYSQFFSPDQPIPEELQCPDPACPREVLRGHGRYQRFVDDRLTDLRRVRCHHCRVSHVVVPEDLCAYRDLSLETLETALTTPGGPSARARATGQSGREGVRRVRRWLRAAEAATVVMQALLPPTPGPWWERAQQAFGTAPGWLVRLRHWLASTWGSFWTGLSGLSRHGRPPRYARGASP